MNQSERIEQVIGSSFDLSEYGSDYHNSNHLKVFQLLLNQEHLGHGSWCFLFI